MMPPATASASASARNCSRTWRGFAPTAMRTPISRVRSLTLTSMMFMMPMPPTSSDTAAMLASSSVSASLLSCLRDAVSVRFLTVKSSSSPTRDAVTIAQQRRPPARATASVTSSDVTSIRIVPGMNFCRLPWIFARNVETGT